MVLQGCCCFSRQVLDRDPESSAEIGGQFPELVKLWCGGEFKYLGSGIKYRKIAFFSIQLYAVALYVEEETATAELKALDKDGFFKDYSEAELCRAIIVGKFKRLLQIQLLRSVTYSQFIGEIGRDLKPRLDKSGDDDLWLEFANYFETKSLAYGSNVLALWKEDGSSEGGWFPAGTTDFQGLTPELKFASPDFGAAIFDVYVGEGGIVPDAKSQWAQSVRALLNQA